MTLQSYLGLRFEQIEKRFSEINLLLNLAAKYQTDIDHYQTLCRSAHVLLVSHFEGLYKDLCKDVIDDINANTKFYEVSRDVAYTHCDFFIPNKTEGDLTHSLRLKLIEAFKDNPSRIKLDPFLFIDNKNPTPTIIETILKRFGIKDFFWYLDGSDLDVVFENSKKDIQRLRNRLVAYTKRNTLYYPYTTSTYIYNPKSKLNIKKTKTFWEDFLNNFLRDRHNIIHGHVLDNPLNHDALNEAKSKIEILIYVYIISLSSVCNPMIFL